MVTFQKIALSIAACLSVSVSQAAITSVTSIEVPNNLPGYVTTDLFISFDGRYTGSQLWLPGLFAGQVYNHAYGLDIAPNAAFVDAFPDLAFDTFVTQGGDRSNTQVGGLALGGGAVNLGAPATPQFDSDGINQSWNPSPGNIIEDQTHFMIARLTLADSVNGSIWFLASAGGSVSDPLQGDIINGRFCPGICPEPSTTILVLLAGIAGIGIRRNS